MSEGQNIHKPVLDAMQKVAEILASLSPEHRAFLVGWVAENYAGISVSLVAKNVRERERAALARIETERGGDK